MAAAPPGRPDFVPSLAQPYPLIDSDPHFSRVLRFMRPSDYVAWAGATAGFPGLFYLWEKLDPQLDPRTRRPLMPALRLGGLLGFVGGFFLAYQLSSKRFWGWAENAREVEKDYREMTKRVKDGKPLYGYTELNDYMQGVAHRNSAFAQLKFSVIPWFNVVNHNRHGVDPAVYGATDVPLTKPKNTA